MLLQILSHIAALYANFVRPGHFHHHNFKLEDSGSDVRLFVIFMGKACANHLVCMLIGGRGKARQKGEERKEGQEGQEGEEGEEGGGCCRGRATQEKQEGQEGQEGGDCC